MDWNSIMQAISTVGFPIVACGVLFYSLEQERKAHAEEMAAVTQALNQNTLIMTELRDTLYMITGKRIQSNDN